MILQSTTDKKDQTKDNYFETNDWISEEEDNSSQRNNELLLALNITFDSAQQ
jgi:hypothetical protein